MKFSEKWLREWVNPAITTQALADQLTMAGIEIESLEHNEALKDTLIEVEITPNRGDCLSIQGIAREIGVLNQLEVTTIPEKVAPLFDHITTVRVQNHEACPRYTGRIIQGIRQNATTPTWIQERLQGSDIGCIHPVVDILNYVMLELGQPMHAFDADKITAPILVRSAHAQEKIVLLNDQEVILKENTLVIADHEGAIAIAGIMGGKHSAVSETTQNIFLESAYFAPLAMAGQARSYGLHTDSSFRFERGVDTALQVVALERASDLILEYCGGECGPVIDIIKQDLLPRPEHILLRNERVQKILGYEIPQATIVDIFQRLGCEVFENEAPEDDRRWLVLPPTYRSDITLEIDLIEEIVRVFGYNQIPSTLPLIHADVRPQSQSFVPAIRLKRALVDMGFQEVITYSFVDDITQKILFPEESSLPLLNPLSQDMNVMRVSLWPGLINAVKYNQNRQQERMKFFEVGLRFKTKGKELIQDSVIGGVLCGSRADQHWDVKTQAADFYDLKQHIESLWQLIGQPAQELVFEASSHSACHPGQCAQISYQAQVIGIIGRLHPQIQKQLDIDAPLYLFELETKALSYAPQTVFARPSRFPEIRRDIALIVDQKHTSGSLTDYVRKHAGNLLRNVQVFDIYMGKGIEPGRKSIALGLILQHPSRTLVDNEIEEVMTSIITGLEKEFDAKLRD